MSQDLFAVKHVTSMICCLYVANARLLESCRFTLVYVFYNAPLGQTSLSLFQQLMRYSHALVNSAIVFSIYTLSAL